jgi:serine protease inhibitor
VTEQLAFTLALHRALAPDPRRDACWSPYSVASALGLVAAGARGSTRDELVALLGDVDALGRLLTGAAKLGDEKSVLAVSNTLWADDMITIREAFAGELSRWLEGSVQTAPFQVAPEKARELINRDVAKTTRNLIPELIPDGAIRPDTVAALVNALYLKCAWRYRFADGATTPRPFHAPGGTKTVPTMELSESIGYASTAGWQVVSLPAAGGVEAVVLLPDGELGDAEGSLTATSLAHLLDAPKRTSVRLRLPKLKVTMRAELTPPLQQLGVRQVFTDGADLGGISEHQLAVDAVFHEAVLKVDEQGFEGAAATAAMMRLVSMDITEPIAVDVDRPFLLLVRHTRTGVGYFLARVVTPGG